MLLILGSILIAVVHGCARTSDAGTGTGGNGGTATTVAIVTTVAPTATTTAAACNNCMASQITLSADPEDGANGHAPTAAAGPDQNGCSTLIITCTPLPGNEAAGSLITFQNGLGGPAPGNPATATLVCNTMGAYQLMDLNGPAVTEAHCFG